MKKVTYKKIGGGSLMIAGKRVKKGDTITVEPTAIPKSFKDLLIPVETVDNVEKTNTKDNETGTKEKPDNVEKIKDKDDDVFDSDFEEDNFETSKKVMKPRRKHPRNKK